jgi:hypothetical protein
MHSSSNHRFSSSSLKDELKKDPLIFDRNLDFSLLYEEIEQNNVKNEVKGNNHSFSIADVSKPLTLHEEETFANKLISDIHKQQYDVKQKKDLKLKEKEDPYKLPEHLDQFRKLFDPPTKVKKKLPIISSLSPRTKNKISSLPKPNDYELAEIRNLEKMTKKIGSSFIYQEITGNPRPLSRKQILEPLVKKPGSPPHSPRKKDSFTTASNSQDADDDSRFLERYIEKTAAQGEILDLKHPEVPVKVTIPAVLPPDNVVVSTTDKTSVYYKQADKFKKEKVKQNEVLSHLLHEEEKEKRSKNDKEKVKEKTTGAERNDEVIEFPMKEEEVLIPMKTKPTSSYARSRPLLNIPASNPKAQLSVKPQSLVISSSSPSNPISPSVLFSQTHQPTSFSSASFLKSNKTEEKEYLNEFSAKVYDELGVNLDSEYNRMRNYKSSLRILFYYFYLLNIRYSMKEWKRITIELRKEQIAKSIHKVVGVFRRFLYFRAKERKAYYESIQQKNETERIAKNQLFLRKNAKIIFRSVYRYWKLMKIKKLVKERRSTLHLQRGIRGFIARKRVQKRILFITFLKNNAIMIQCIYRKHLAERKVNSLRDFTVSFVFFLVFSFFFHFHRFI